MEEYTQQPHFCFVNPKNLGKLIQEDHDPRIIVAYDIESTQIELANTSANSEFIHKPNLLICHLTCQLCWNPVTLERMEKCKLCGKKEHVFWGFECVEMFGDFLYNDLAKRASRIDGKVLVYAHNARGYDSHFILKDLWKRGFKDVQIIMNGRKILKIDVANVRLADSLSLFLQPLANLPKAFNLPLNLKKGDFPHLFNMPENWEYIGSLPDIEYFGIAYMSPHKADEFRKWYNETKESGFVFDFKKNLLTIVGMM